MHIWFRGEKSPQTAVAKRKLMLQKCMQLLTRTEHLTCWDGRMTFQKKLFSKNMIEMPSSLVIIIFYTDVQLQSNIHLVFTTSIFRFDGIWIYYYKCSQIRYSNVLLQVKVTELILGRKQNPLKKKKIQLWRWLGEEGSVTVSSKNLWV